VESILFTHFHAISFAVLVFSQPFYIFDTINFATALEEEALPPKKLNGHIELSRIETPWHVQTELGFEAQ
jgi:hypothetical protein